MYVQEVLSIFIWWKYYGQDFLDIFYCNITVYFQDLGYQEEQLPFEAPKPIRPLRLDAKKCKLAHKIQFYNIFKTCF